MTQYTHIRTSLGQLLLTRQDAILTGLYFTGQPHTPAVASDWQKDGAGFTGIKQQLDEYLSGRRQTFDLAFRCDGTPFQRQVWEAVFAIPYGQRQTYKEIAAAIGRPKAVRAVGTAIGRNPVCVIGPCHRVIASNGTLGGYAGGLANKALLLRLESGHNADKMI
jgi:O-6-methylguanine DNA methyltransferase